MPGVALAALFALLSSPIFWCCVVALTCAGIIGAAIDRTEIARQNGYERIVQAIRQEGAERGANIEQLLDLLDYRLPGRRIRDQDLDMRR